MTILRNVFGGSERTAAIPPSLPNKPAPEDISAHSATVVSPSFTERDMDAARAIGEDMVRVANESLAIANESRDIAIRESRTRLTRVYLTRLKRLSMEYPFLKLTALHSFEESIK